MKIAHLASQSSLSTRKRTLEEGHVETCRLSENFCLLSRSALKETCRLSENFCRLCENFCKKDKIEILHLFKTFLSLGERKHQPRIVHGGWRALTHSIFFSFSLFYFCTLMYLMTMRDQYVYCCRIGVLNIFSCHQSLYLFSVNLCVIASFHFLLLVFMD